MKLHDEMIVDQFVKPVDHQIDESCTEVANTSASTWQILWRSKRPVIDHWLLQMYTSWRLEILEEEYESWKSTSMCSFCETKGITLFSFCDDASVRHCLRACSGFNHHSTRLQSDADRQA